MSDILNRHRKIWSEKKILRVVYSGWYGKILKDLKPGTGKTVELGAGSGNFKEFKPDVISSDIDSCDWLDMCFDAHSMPFRNESLTNIVMIDVFHHLANPLKFLLEATRVLEKGGRLIMVEPFPALFSLFVYRKFHSEPFSFNTDYFSITELNKKDPWQANQAAAYLIFYKYRKKLAELTGAKFKIIKKRKMSCILYPLSGGFENKALIPDFLIPPFKLIEYLLVPFRFLLAFRCYIILEKI